MIVAAVEYVADYIDRINKVLGLSMEFEYRIESKGKFPICRKGNDIVIVPEFFNHKEISEAQRKMMITLFYAVIYLGRTRKVHPVDPEHLAKGICDALKEEYIPLYIIEETLRAIRISMYDEPEYASFFSVGDEIRVSCCSRYRVIDVKKEEAKVYVVAEPIGYKAQFSKEPRTFEEAEFYEMYTHHEDYSDFNVDLRKNLIILSAPSATGKNTVYNALKSSMPEIKRAVTVTTRAPRASEAPGIDYYFCSKDEFDKKKKNCEFVEYNEYDNNYYATPYSEINKHSLSTPLFLIVDTHGMMSIMRKYPLSTSVFLAPPSMEELERRIRERGDNTPEEIKRRIDEANREMKNSDWYDYVIKNVHVNECVEELEGVLRNRLNENGIFKTTEGIGG